MENKNVEQASFDGKEMFGRAMSDFHKKYGHLSKEEQVAKLIDVKGEWEQYFRGYLQSMMNAGGTTPQFVATYFEVRKFNNMIQREIQKRTIELTLMPKQKRAPGLEMVK